MRRIALMCFGLLFSIHPCVTLADTSAFTAQQIQYKYNRSAAFDLLESTRVKLLTMIERRGGNPQTVLLTGDMVKYWKNAKSEFDLGNYDETVRICSIIQKYIY